VSSVARTGRGRVDSAPLPPAGSGGGVSSTLEVDETPQPGLTEGSGALSTQGPLGAGADAGTPGAAGTVAGLPGAGADAGTPGAAGTVAGLPGAGTGAALRHGQV
jgi:hypothetical protein